MPWVKAIDETALEPYGVAGAVANGQRLAIYVVEGEYFATSDICTHGQASLSEGFLDGHLIECPLHQGLFDVRTGEPAGEPVTEPVRKYPTKVEDGVVYVEVE
jgi:naphthalene 1,2-dioxygenase system ferredoxin subunit